MTKPVLNIGMIGTGFMGQAHAIAYQAAPTVFPLAAHIQCELLADQDAQLTAHKAGQFGFRRSTDDWRALVTDAQVDIVDICSPNYLHKEMALAAIAAGKHVYCEKPLALSASDALEMTLAAERAGVHTLVGFNYARNPAAQLAREMIDAGELGELVHFRGIYTEDYLADPSLPHSWRLTRARAGAGALADLGSHLIHMAQYLVGEVVEVNANLQTVIRQRPTGVEGVLAEVENDDMVQALVRFEQGASGTFEISRINWGRKCGLVYEITGTRGTLVFDQERMSELHWYSAADARGRSGFRRLLLGPEHPDYRHFCVAAGHGLGYNDQKIVEVRDLIEAVAGGRSRGPDFDFRAGYRVNCVMDAIEASHRRGCWQRVAASV